MVSITRSLQYGDGGTRRRSGEASALTLLVLRILLIDHVDAAFPPNNLVVGTTLLYARTYFHR